MTIQELHTYIDRTLGNNVRCLLSSFWWKKLFHLVVDKVESVENKIDNIQLPEGGVEFLKLGATQEGDDLTTEELAHNAEIYKRLTNGTLRGPIVAIAPGTYMVLSGPVLDGENSYRFQHTYYATFEEGCMIALVTIIFREDGSFSFLMDEIAL